MSSLTQRYVSTHPLLLVGEDEALAGFPLPGVLMVWHMPRRGAAGRQRGGGGDEDKEEVLASGLRPLETLYAELLEAIQVGVTLSWLSEANQSLYCL